MMEETTDKIREKVEKLFEDYDKATAAKRDKLYKQAAFCVLLHTAYKIPLNINYEAVAESVNIAATEECKRVGLQPILSTEQQKKPHPPQHPPTGMSL